MKFLKFLISKVFIKNISLIIIISVIIVYGTLFFLDIFTLHGKTMPVPDFYGMSISEVDSCTIANELRFEITDSVYNVNEEKGVVLEQNPKPNFHVKRNRTIFLTINAFFPERVKVPDLVGISLRDARAKLESFGLLIDKIISKPDLANNNVLAQKIDGIDILPGEIIEKGSKIDLIVGKITDEKTYVPSILSLSVDQARIVLNRNELNLGAIIYDSSIETFEDSTNAKIWKQVPSPNSKKNIRLGSSIDVWLKALKAKSEQEELESL